MDYFLKTFSLQKEREGRVREFFSKQITPLANSTNKHSIDLEIGCGHGHWINEYAQKNKENICIGIDLISKRIKRANVKKQNAANTNLFFLKAEAYEFIKYKPEELVFSNIFVFFPDPWPKKKHHKRRLIQNSFLNLLKLHTHSQSRLFFRTDHQEYYEWTKLEIQISKFWELSNHDWPLEHQSYFQELLPNFSSLSANRL